MSTTYPDVDATDPQEPVLPCGIHEAMIQIMRETSAIGKDQTNTQQNFKFRGIDQIYNKLHGIFARHGVYTTSEVLNVERQERLNKSGNVLLYTIATIRYHFHAADGSSTSTDVIGEGMDSGDKATNKAMAIAHKYALLQALMIPTEDMVDPDSESPEVSAPSYTDQQKKAYDKMLAAEDGLGIHLLFEGVGFKTSMDLYHSFPKGTKGKMQKLSDDLVKQGKATAQYIADAIAKGDSLMAKEALEGALPMTVKMAQKEWPDLAALLAE